MKKAGKRLYMLYQLKGAWISYSDLVTVFLKNDETVFVKQIHQLLLPLLWGVNVPCN